jgi:predicted ATP-binding protein involved in virulence
VRIDRLIIFNFKAFRLREINFDPHFNLIVGDNATGKTSLLDALAIAMDSWFLGMRTAEKAGGIDTGHVHLATYLHGDTATFEKQFPSRIEARGVVLGDPVNWARELSREGGKTTTGEAKEISSLAERADTDVRDGREITLPLICSYGTERLWFESRHYNKPSKKGDTTPKRPSRFDGYRDCTAFEIQQTVLLEWMQAQFLTSKQLEQSTNAWNLVKGAVIDCVENATDLNFDPRYNEFVIRQESLGDQLFSNLSDGQRIMLTLIGDLVRRIVTLNPHLEERALLETSGIVLVDELDLHLHPKWQRRVIGDLKRTFPKIQFVATTHSPQLIGEALPTEIHILEDGKVTRPARSFGVDSSAILDEVMHVSPRNSEIEELLKRLAELIDREDVQRAREVLAQVEARLGTSDPEVTGATTLLTLLESTR